jgi:hypothetical protein
MRKKTLVGIFLFLLVSCQSSQAATKVLTCYMDPVGPRVFKFYGNDPIQTIHFEYIDMASTYAAYPSNFSDEKLALIQYFSSFFPGAITDAYLQGELLFVVFEGNAAEVDYSELDDNEGTFRIEDFDLAGLKSWMEENIGTDCKLNDEELVCTLQGLQDGNVYIYTGEKPLESLHMDIYAFPYQFGVTAENFEERKKLLMNFLSTSYVNHAVDVELNGNTLHFMVDGILSEMPDYKNKYGFDAETITLAEIRYDLMMIGGVCEISE